MFAEAFHSMIKGIHLALEVKTSFGSSMLGAPIESRHKHRRKEEKEKQDTKSYKAKLERLRSATMTRHDQAVNF
jgi:hypothetical protein